MAARANEDTTQFETLLLPVLDAAYRLARSLTRDQTDAEDLVQDACVKAFCAFNSFSKGSNFKAWFLKILVNTFLNDKRKQERRPATTELNEVSDEYLYREAKRGARRGEEPAAAFLQKLNVTQIAQAFAALPTEFRVVAALYFFEELTYEQIAEFCSCPVGTVRSRLFRARRLLQKALYDEAQTEYSP